MKLPITKLLVFFFARQGLSGPYQISSNISYVDASSSFMTIFFNLMPKWSKKRPKKNIHSISGIVKKYNLGKN
jgi:predicted flavoprotein YhiN